jgi:hypothetical protein
MFNLNRMLTFWRKTLQVLLPIFGSQFILVVLAMQVREKPLTGWRFVLGIAAGFAPAALAIIAGFVFATSYMQALYALKGKREAFWFIVHCMIGQAGFKPWLMVESGKLNEGFCSPDGLISKAGGPGNLIVRKDSAVVLEQAGRLTRVAGPGFTALGRFERLYDTIDLRPRRWQLPVSGMSKEGIPVTCDTDVVFQILDDGREPTGDNPFPMDPEAVFRAATSKWIREAHRPEGDQVLDWKGLIVVSAMEGTLRFILARYPLDRLIAPEREGEE